ncbi:hypothetical protein [Luteolibacter soli]|uniref:PepSY domain-containing protein n=1 Tax=Luteolibacter soli TaxID=3135280 RepID=A0ABU9B4Y6_9BACT
MCPWHRSRLFWLGLPALAFLLWLGIVQPVTSFTLNWTDHRLSLGTRDGRFTSILETGRGGFAIAGQTGTAQGISGKRFFPSAFKHSVFNLSSAPGPYRLTTLFIAAWFVALLYLILWSALLLVWQRHKARLLESTSNSP